MVFVRGGNPRIKPNEGPDVSVGKLTSTASISFLPFGPHVSVRSVSFGERESFFRFPKTVFLFMLVLVLLTLFMVIHRTPKMWVLKRPNSLVTVADFVLQCSLCQASVFH